MLASAGSVRRALGDAEPAAAERGLGPTPPAAALRRLIGKGFDQLPLPGAGRTLDRWRALAAVGATDLSLAKLYEGHTDALAILAELSPARPSSPRAMWGVWAAEAAGTSLDWVPTAQQPMLRDGETGTLRGVKPWCSGASAITHALVTAHVGGGQRQLFAVNLGTAGLRVDSARWRAVGMAASASADVTFDDVMAVAVGAPGAYLQRPGFWHGGAGVAACWFGAARELALVLCRAPHGAAAEVRALRALALGRVSVALTHSAALLARTAAAIDAEPAADLADAVRLLRLSVEQTARLVQDEVLRALGPTPICRDAALAQLVADLPIFIRQCHGDGDLLQAGQAAAQAAQTAQAQADGHGAWSL